jgi:rubredoxin
MVDKAESRSSRKLAWVKGQTFEGWGCSECAWVFDPSGAPVGTTLDEMKRNFEAQLSEEFSSHACAGHSRIRVAKPLS